MQTDLDPRAWEAWEIDPSTRDSLHLWTKYYPVSVTLSVAGTAQNIFTVPTDVPTVNLVSNPSFETGTPPTGFTASGSTLSRDNTYAQSGTYSIKVDPDNAASGEGFYWTSTTLAGKAEVNQFRYLVASASTRDAADSGDGVQLIIADSTGTALATGTAVALSTTFQRMQVAYRLPASGAAYRIYAVNTTQNDTDFWVDDLQVEIREDINPTTYCDGAQGVNYEWFGTAHASVSRRRMGLVAIRGWDFFFDKATYVGLDQTASSTTGIYIPAASMWSPEHGVHLRDKISILNVTLGETPTVRGVIWGVHYGKG